MRKKMWHCKNCGRVCDSSNNVCPDCGLDLGFYGEIQFVETGESSSSPSGSQPQAQAEPVVEEGSKPKPKKERKAKERKPEKKGKRGKVLILVGAVLFVLLALGGFMTIRRVDDIFLRSDGTYTRFDTTKDLSLESGSKGEIWANVYVTGFWGPLPELTVTSNDNSVVNVSENYGVIVMKAGEPGKAQITVKAGGKSVSYRVSVYQVTGVELDITEGLELKDGIVLGLEDSAGYTVRLQYTGEVNEKDLPQAKVSSSDTDIVEVDSESGKIIAKGYGTAMITASVGDCETSIPVNVFDVTKVELQCYDLLVNRTGETLLWIPEGLSIGSIISYSYKGPYIGDFPYTFESSDENVLSVGPNFTITAVSPGIATITAALGSCSDSVTLEVYPVDRSTGAWIKGSIQTIATPAEDSSSKADCTTTVCFSDGVEYITVGRYFGVGGKFDNHKEWEDVSDQYPNEAHTVKAFKETVVLEGSEWDQRRKIAGIYYLFKRASSEPGDYNPATDLLDYWVIYTE